MERRHQEQKSLEDKKYADEIQFLKKTNQQLKVWRIMVLIKRKNMHVLIIRNFKKIILNYQIYS